MPRGSGQANVKTNDCSTQRQSSFIIMLLEFKKNLNVIHQ